MSPRSAKLNEQMRKEAITKITRAALEVFARYGYHGATMRQIMEASGLSKGLVYHYFPSKESIFFHLVESALNISKNAWDEVLASPGTAWEKIEKLSEITFRISFTDENSLYFLIMLQALTQADGIPGLMEYIGEHTTHYDRLPSLIAEAQKTGEAVSGDPVVLMNSYYALFQGYTLILLHDRELQQKISPETFTDLLRKKR